MISLIAVDSKGRQCTRTCTGFMQGASIEASWVRPDWDDEESVKWFKERSKVLSAIIKANPERYECSGAKPQPVSTSALHV